MTPRTKAGTRALTVRKLPADHYEWLRTQAVAHGRSMEAEMRAILARARHGSAEWPAGDERKTGQVLRGFAEQAVPSKAVRSRKSQPMPSKKRSTHAAIARLQALFAKATKNRKSKKLLSEEFLEERRRMWGEE